MTSLEPILSKIPDEGKPPRRHKAIAYLTEKLPDHQKEKIWRAKIKKC